MSTPLEVFRPALRIMLQDWDASVQMFSNTVLDQGIQSAVQMGRVTHLRLNTVCTLTPARDAIEPELSTVDAGTFALVVYRTAWLFLAGRPDRYSYRTRAISESFGSLSRFVASLEADMHALENGSLFAGYQHYFSWLSGMSGLPLDAVLTQFDVCAPLWRASLTGDGLSYNAG